MSIVPTAAFARRRHLLRRIALLSKEDVMSSRRFVLSCAVMALVVPLGTWGAVSAFPLHAALQASQIPAGPGSLERRSHAVTPENPVPRRVHYEAPIVPDIAESASGTVVLKITLDEGGMVAEARPVSIRVKAPEIELSVVDDNNLGPRMAAFLAGFRDSGKASDVVNALVDSAMTSVKAWRYDPPAQAPLTFGVTIRFGDADSGVRGGIPGGVPGGVPGGIAAGVPGGIGKGVPGGIAKATVGLALRVGGEIKPPLKLVDVRPVYPADARAAGIKGVVILEARIDAEGNVETARAIKSIPELDQAAIDAVKQWKFEPTLMNGVPMPVIMTVTINFSLPE
jgi:TonB family protein